MDVYDSLPSVISGAELSELMDRRSWSSIDVDRYAKTLSKCLCSVEGLLEFEIRLEYMMKV